MKLLSLKLRGAIGIREGLGLEEININFRQFSPGLIAIMGENGAGKTTFLENLHPFRFLKSRLGGLARQFFLKDSCRDLLVAIGEDEYRFLIEMNPTLKTPAIKSYVYKNGECLTPDGNEEGYTAIVRKLFGNETLFFSSLFMTQKRLPFSKLEPGPRKEMLLELIGAGHLQAKCDYANLSAKGLREDIASKNGEIEALNRSTRPIEAIESDIDLCQKALDADRLKIVGLDTEIVKNKADLEIYQTKQTEQAVAQSQLSQAKSRLQGLSSELSQAESSFGSKAKQLKIFIDTDQHEIGKLALQCSPEDEAAVDGCIAMAEQVKTDYLATVESRQEYDRLMREYSQARYDFDTARLAHERGLQMLQSQVANAQNTFEMTKTKVDHKRKELTDEITRKTRATHILQTVPCQDESIAIECRDACRSCQFLKDATSAIAEITQLSRRLTEGETAWTALSTSLQHEITTAQAAADANPTWEVTAAPLQASIDGATASVKALGFDAVASEKLKCEYEECEKADYPGRKQRILGARAKLESLTQKVADNQKRLEDLQNEETNKVGELNDLVCTVKSEITALEPQIEITIELRLRDIRDALKRLESIKQSTAETATRSEANIARLTEDKNQAGQSAEELQSARAKLAALQADLADWDHLATNLSRNGGYQSYLVESAGAEITPFANELLANYGVPWTIEIATSRPSADGKKFVDGFYCIINTPTGSRELADLSGGQEVWIDTVLYDAIGNLLRRRSGLNLQTCIKDESDGQLDGDHAMAYLRAIEYAHKSSKLWHTILITHREEIQQAIPQRLRFERGKGIVMELA